MKTYFISGACEGCRGLLEDGQFLSLLRQLRLRRTFSAASSLSRSDELICAAVYCARHKAEIHTG